MNIRRVVGAGLAASVIMGMIEMVYEAVAGAGYWSPAVFIGATMLRGLQSIQVPVPFHLAGVVLGLMGHMMNSVIFGFIFARVVAPLVSPRGDLVIAGVVYGVIVFALMWFAVIPIIDPVMLKLNAAVFAIAHLVWGAALGAIVSEPEEAPRAIVALESSRRSR
ncbi:MAG: hypothetical protein HY355_07005 [Armatimonadetes bacterium]|nr:hypothetical protein [Armatimonadota bacterium]